MGHIFVSYAREDEERIQPLVRALENRGWSVFWDRRIPTGQTWRSYIGKALSDASCVIVAWSHHSIASSWVSEEADEGKRRGLLVPVLLDSVQPPLGFRSIQTADLTNWQPENPSPHFEQLLRDIKAIRQAGSTETLSVPLPEGSNAPRPHAVVSERPPRPAGSGYRTAFYVTFALFWLVLLGSFIDDEDNFNFTYFLNEIKNDWGVFLFLLVLSAVFLILWQRIVRKAKIQR